MLKSLNPDSLPAAIDNLIIKRNSVTAARYAERVEAEARNLSKNIIEEADNAKEALLEQAKAEGYLLGLDTFIQHMLTTLDTYQRVYEDMLAFAKTTLTEQLTQALTSDALLGPLLKAFSEQYADANHICIFLPRKLEKILSDDINALNKNIQITWTEGTTVSIEIGSEIMTFSAENYSRNLYRTADNIIYRSERYKKFSMLKEHALQQARQLVDDKLLTLSSSPSTSQTQDEAQEPQE